MILIWHNSPNLPIAEKHWKIIKEIQDDSSHESSCLGVIIAGDFNLDA